MGKLIISPIMSSYFRPLIIDNFLQSSTIFSSHSSRSRFCLSRSLSPMVFLTFSWGSRSHLWTGQFIITVSYTAKKCFYTWCSDCFCKEERLSLVTLCIIQKNRDSRGLLWKWGTTGFVEVFFYFLWQCFDFISIWIIGLTSSEKSVITPSQFDHLI